MEEKVFTCDVCSWNGARSMLQYDIVDTCFASDRIEVCPVCGSYELHTIISAPSPASEKNTKKPL